MARKKHTKMRITDFQIKDDKAIIAVEIRRGQHVWHKSYGMSRESVRSFDFELFKERIYNDSKAMISDQELEDAAMRKIREFMGPDIMLD
jgi:hypothetical protein